MTTTFDGTADFAARVGEHLGYSHWWRITAEHVDLFERATGDHPAPSDIDLTSQPMGPFTGPVTHGYLTLALAPVLLASIYQVRGSRMWINYGLNRLRFPAPVPVGARVRAGAELAGAEAVPGGAQVVIVVTIEVEGAPKPGCVADVVFRYYDDD